MINFLSFFLNLKSLIDYYLYYYGNVIFCILAAVLLLIFAVLFYRTIRIGRHNSMRFRLPQPKQDIILRASESLAKAISFQTITGNTDEIHKFHDFLKQRFPLVFSKTSVDIINGGSLLIRWKCSKPSKALPVLFMGHLDVVAADGKWSFPPFDGTKKNGKIFGRGTLDCKNVVISLLEAFESLLSEGFVPNRDIYFAFGHDEEVGGNGGAALISRLFERKNIKFDMVLDEGGAITSDFMGSRKAVALVGIGEKEMCNIRVTACCTAGHAANPSKNNSIAVLSEAVCRINSAPPKRRMLPIIENYYKNIAPFLPFWKRFLCVNLPFTRHLAMCILSKNNKCNADFRTTFAPTIISGGNVPNILPEEAFVNINVRLLPGENVDDTVRYISNLLSDLPCKIEVISSCNIDNKISPVDSEIFQLLEKTITARFGDIPVIPTLLHGGTDSKHYQNVCENVCENVYRFMPFAVTEKQLATIHGDDENVSQEALGAAVEFYKLLIKSL